MIILANRETFFIWGKKIKVLLYLFALILFSYYDVGCCPLQSVWRIDIKHHKSQIGLDYFVFRFHIYCSERLCEEDMMTFDAKINNENLTKSLQTLKELYNDLMSKHGLTCPNEAEFRAYIVLMNLNEGDILR